MARLKIELCPNCGKGEIIRYPDTALDHHEKCPICNEDLVIPSNALTPVRVYRMIATVGSGDPWTRAFDGIKSLSAH